MEREPESEQSKLVAARPRSGTRDAIALALVLLAALGVRLISLPNEAAWHDEIATLEFLDAPNLGEFLRQTHAVTPVPPGYSITQFLWSRAFGDSVLALRALSLVYGIAGLGALYGLGRSLFGHRAGLIAAAWMSFVCWHIYHSQEIRFYSMITLLATLMVWSFVRFVARPTAASLALHAAASAAAIWTHPFTVLLFAAIGLFLCKYHWGRWRWIAAWTALHASLAASLVVFLALIDRDVAYAQAGWLSRPTFWGDDPSVRTFLAMGTGVMAYPPVNDAGAALLTARDTLWAAVEVITLAGFAAAIALLVRRSPQPSAAPRLSTRDAGDLLALWFVIPPVVAYAGSLIWQPMFHGRYLLFVFPPVYLGLGWLLSRRGLAVAALAFAPLILFDALYYFPGPFRARYDRVAELIQQDPEPVRDIYIDDMIAQSALQFYWNGPAPVFHNPLELEEAVGMRSGEMSFQAPSNWLLMSSAKRARYLRQDLRRANVAFAVRPLRASHPLWLFHVTVAPLPDTPSIIEQR